MTEYIYNIYDETAEIITDEFGVVIKMPNGDIKTFCELENAINYLYRRGFIY